MVFLGAYHYTPIKTRLHWVNTDIIAAVRLPQGCTRYRLTYIERNELAQIVSKSEDIDLMEISALRFGDVSFSRQYLIRAVLTCDDLDFVVMGHFNTPIGRT